MINLKQLYKENRKTFWKYAGASVFISIFTFGFMYLFVSELKIHYLLSFFFIGGAGWFGKYLLNKYWVFNHIPRDVSN